MCLVEFSVWCKAGGEGLGARWATPGGAEGLTLPLSLLKGPEDGGNGIQVDCMLGRHPVIPTLLAPASGELNLKSCPFFPLSAGNSVQPQV